MYTTCSKTILLPLDGSPLAERALPYAAALARGSGAAIVLVEAVQAPARSGQRPGCWRQRADVAC